MPKLCHRSLLASNMIKLRYLCELLINSANAQICISFLRDASRDESNSDVNVVGVKDTAVLE